MAKGIGHWYVEIEKQAFWRGKPHQWVNRYVLNGASDPTTADATSVINGLKGVENNLFPDFGSGAGVGFVEGRAYSKNGGPPIATVGYNVSLAPGSATGFAGPSAGYTTLGFGVELEFCLEVRTPLTGLSSTGKPVFLRKFYRGINGPGQGGSETPIGSADLAIANNTVKPLATGLGGTAYYVISAGGRTASADPTVQPFSVNHQVPRGRKRASRAGLASSAAATGFAQGAALATKASTTTTTNENNVGNTNINVPFTGLF